MQALKGLMLVEAINRLSMFVLEKLHQQWGGGKKLRMQLIDGLLNAAASLFLKPQTANPDN